MVQGAPQTAGRFDDEIRMYKAPPPEVSSEQFYETDPTKPYRRGWSIQTVSPLPITWAEHVAAQGHWGAPLREYMRDYVHWATLGALCEYLPQPDNRVTLADEKDRHGLPVAHFSYTQCDNDKQLTKAATASMETILHAAGATEVMTIDRYAHLVGGARMAARAEDGVVDARPPRLRRAEPLRRRRQHAAHPGRGQPGADDHGARGPRRRPAHRASAAAGSPNTSCRLGMTATTRRRSRGVQTAVYTFPTPEPEADGTLQLGRHHRRHRDPRSRRRDRAGLDLQQPGGRGRHRRPPRRCRPRPVRVRHRAGAGRRCTAPCRNLGTRGLVMQAISAVDIAWWDLKARLLDVPLTALLGRCRDGRADLRLRRLHHAHRRRTRRAGRLVALGRVHRHEDQDR